jgi:hypothetical protein
MIDNVKKKRLQYDRANLQRAHEAIVKGMSVYRAARQYNVPESTLRDRTRGNYLVCFSSCALLTKMIILGNICLVFPEMQLWPST